MIRIMKSGEIPASELFARTASDRDVSGTVAEIIANVRKNGDAALMEYNAKFDRAEGVALEVTPEELEAAVEAVVLVIRDDRGVQHIVQIALLVQVLPQLFHFLTVIHGFSSV